jgi:hypothetical protein
MSAKEVLGTATSFGRRTKVADDLRSNCALISQLLGLLRFAREAASVMVDQLTIEQAMPRTHRATTKIVICPRSFGTGD